MKWTNHIVRESASIYFEAFMEACCKAHVPPRRALVDTDEYPKLHRISDVEYSIGWLHGCADSHGVTVETLYDILYDALMAQQLDKVRGKLAEDVLKLERRLAPKRKAA